jgi:two-component system LytT family sensor kinase
LEGESSSVIRRPRFWLIYAAAWLPYAASYVAIFLVQSSAGGLYGAVTDMLYNVVSAAVLGLGVMWFCRRVPWTLHKHPWFFPAHLIAAALYSLSWCAAVTAVLTAVVSFRRGQFLPFIFSGYSLQWQLFSGLMIYGTLASVSYTVQIVERLRQEEARAARAENLRVRAELEALRAKLNPHFLFNTLHTLMALVRQNPRAAEQALERFAALLRYTLNLQRASPGGGADEVDDVRLGSEWKFVEHYLALEGLRLGPRLRVEADVRADTLDCVLPALTLQPLVENAIKHGIAPRAAGGVLRISARLEGDETLRVEVCDDGPGAPPSSLNEGGLGLRLVRQRLETRYRGGAEFRIETKPGAGFKVVVCVPQDGAPDGAERETAWQYAR